MYTKKLYLTNKISKSKSKNICAILHNYLIKYFINNVSAILHSCGGIFKSMP